MREGYLPREERKKILLLSDDLRMPSGVGVMSREIVEGTCHKYNWIQLGAAVQHPEAGKVLDASESLSQETGVENASLKIFPYNGYGDATVIRNLLMLEQPDAILHFTDPRYWIWLYQIEHEIREICPLMFYHVWDDLPFPRYNEPYYRSCDFIASISRQTHNIVRQVWQKNKPEPWQTKFIPHGIDPKKFYKYTEASDLERVANLKKQVFGGQEVDFVVLYNNRNVRRKMTGDVILAYREFYNKLTDEQKKKCRLLLHTQPVDENGTDLIRLIRDITPEIEVVFSTDRVDTRAMNDIYNMTDVVINMASNEGFGLGTLEGIMAERMIIANVTGGLQDQMGFRDENDNFVNEEDHFNADWGSNHDGRYKKCGEWTLPLFPNNRALIGSPPTPYIYDDRCTWSDGGNAILEAFNMGPEERARRGALGREYALTQGFSAEAMANNFIDGIEGVFQNWKPRKRAEMVKV